MNTGNKKVVVVLGMHRSGTSAITRALETMGVQLGDHLMPPAAGNNEKGFFEDVEINAINIDLLKALDNDWQALAPIPVTELLSDKYADLRLRAIAVLRSRLQQAGPFGFKDPRVCRLLPFWQQVFAHLGLDDAYVIALRNPLSVARSLEKRDRLPREKCYYLWLEHMMASVTGTRGKPRVVVDYDSLMEAPQVQIRRMAEGLGLVVDAAAASAFAEEFLEEGLRHAVFQPEDSLVDPLVPSHVRELFKVLSDVALQRTDLDAAAASLEHVAAEVAGLTQAFEYVGRQEREIADLRRRVHDKDVHIGNIEAINAQNAQAVHRLAASEAEVARLARQVHDKDVHIGNIEAALGAGKVSFEELTHTLAAVEADAEQLRKQVHDKDVHIGNLEATVALRDGRIAEQDARLAEASGEIGRANSELADVRRQLGEVTAQFGEATAQLGAAAEEATRLQGESQGLRQAVHDKDVHIENLTAAMRRLQAQGAMLGHRAARQRASVAGTVGKPLRALKDLAWRAGAPRGVDLIPVAQLSRTKQGWRAEGSEPEFLLEPGRAWSGLKGWHTLELPVRMSGSGTMRLTFDVGASGRETIDIEVPAGHQGSLSVPVFVPDDCMAVRLRPCDTPMDFELPGCSMKALAKAPAISSAHADVYERLGGRGGNAGRLVPLGGVVPLDADYAWMATNGDPHFSVGGIQQLRPGWYMAEVLIHSEVNAGAAKFYMDYGSGFSETATALLPFRSGVVAKRLMRFDPVPAQIRFDPMERKARFSVAQLNFAPVWRWFARDRMLKRLENHDDEFRGSPRRDIVARLKAQSKALEKPLEDLLWERYGATFTSQGESAMSYGEWVEKIELPGLPDAVALKYMLQEIDPKPKFSVVVPTYNPAVGHLRACIESVLAQSYEHWELCIADDASTQPHVREILREYEARDPRIKVCYRSENGHISRASNSALELATGDFVALLDHDDKLAEHALLFMADAIHRHPAVQVLYSDEDKLDENGDRVDPHFKSGWNPDLFYAQNYVSHLGVYRRSLLEKIGGFRAGVEGSQDQDLLLRCLPHLKDTDVVHVPRVLYHWRTVAGSTAQNPEEKSYTTQAGIRALRDHFTSLGKADIGIEPAALPNTYRLRWPLPSPPPLASLIIPTRDRRALTEVAVRSILKKTTYPNYEILIVDNGSVEAETLEFFEQIQREDQRVRVLRYDHPFNYSAINNFAERHARGDILGLVNNDVEVVSADWLTEMVSHACRPEIGCVGAKLYYTNDTIQHGGVILGLGGVAGHSHKTAPRHSAGYFGRLKLVQSLSAVTGACLIVRREVYREVGGLDEDNLAIAFNDVDFCLRVQAAGYRNLWTPYAELYHHESISRGLEDTPEKVTRFQGEVRFMMDKWGDTLKSDRYYNRNLTYQKEDFSIEWDQNERSADQ
ncbi:MAG: glycosyl transferase family 2 [Ramlibacter sp.]|nr:glycosyl transferase family 2 [Ramlibacter sp.]